MIIRVSVKEKLGETPATPRQVEAFLQTFLAAKVGWVLDFEGVTELKDEFIEGFFLKIAEIHGAKVFENQLTWVNLLHAERFRLHKRLMDHLSQNRI